MSRRTTSREGTREYQAQRALYCANAVAGRIRRMEQRGQPVTRAEFRRLVRACNRAHGRWR
jgi:hypothetical protein